MSKKDYVLIAETLNAYSFTDPQDKVNLANRFAEALRHTNPAFSKSRFIDAVVENRYSHTAGHAINQ